MDERTRQLMHSSGRSDWSTPQPFFDRLNEIYHFDLDPAASAENAKCAEYFTAEQNGLRQSWKGHRVFLNPPYGKQEKACAKRRNGNYSCKKSKCVKRGYHIDEDKPGVIDWVRKCSEEAHHAFIVALLPVRTDTKWWHKYVWDAEKDQPYLGICVKFIKGRISFVLPGGKSEPAPFPSVLVIWELDNAESEY